MIPKMWIDKDGEPMVSFTFKGAEAGWVTAKRHTNECVPRGHRSTECTYNVTIYSTFLSELMHLLSESVKRRTGLEPPTSCVTLGECWNCLASASPRMR